MWRCSTKKVNASLKAERHQVVNESVDIFKKTNKPRDERDKLIKERNKLKQERKFLRQRGMSSRWA